jgi:anaerobic magnesium-protoporphyrin IX monomethyl ester cyclase
MALAGHLLRLGHEVTIVDAALLREDFGVTARRVAELAPDLIGISGIITAYAYIIELSRALRQHLPAVPIVLGGQVGINNVDNCFRHMDIDFLVHGYGEIALEKLLHYHAGSHARELIPGISYRQGDRVTTNPGREFFPHLSDRARPTYHLVDMDHYVRELGGTKTEPLVVNGRVIRDARAFTVYAALGCTDRCSFCVHEQEYVGIKLGSNEWALREMTVLHDTYGVNVFNMGEEMFISKLPRAVEFDRLMRERLPDCYWRATTRADFVTPELIEALSGGNCISLMWGYESGSQRILDLMKKRVTVAVNNRAYRLARDAGMYENTTIMVGFPGETLATINETIASIRSVGMARSSVFLATPYPGGRLWDWCVERGLITDTHAYLKRVSDRDAQNLNLNLTPYPDWVLLGMQAMVRSAIEDEARRTDPDHPMIPSKRFGRRHQAKLIVRDLGRRLLPVALRGYFAWYGLRSKLYQTKRDRMCAVTTDAKGAILPQRLIVGAPQRAMTNEEITHLLGPAARGTEGK